MTRHTRPHRMDRGAQQGAALAVSLFILVILTILGLAALRATQSGLRVARNSETRASAQQNAEAMVSLVLEDQTKTYLPVNDNAGFRACNDFVATLPLVVAGAYAADCPSATRTAKVVDDGNSVLMNSGYVVVRRVLPLFAESSILREAENSGRAIDFAHYQIIGGFDGTTSSAGSTGAAEVSDDRLVPHAKPSLAGINLD